MDRIERREFVRKHRTCIFGYNRQNDGPAMTVVYYVLDGDDLLISTMAAGKALAVERDPKVGLVHPGRAVAPDLPAGLRVSWRTLSARRWTCCAGSST